MTDVGYAFLGRGWAFPVQPAADDVAMVAYDEDVRQAILLILQTDRGERVMRPDFGAGLDAFVFEPMSRTTLALIRHRVEEALVTWEPRIDLRDVRVTTDAPATGRVSIQIDYVVRKTNSFYNLVYPFYIQEGRP